MSYTTWTAYPECSICTHVGVMNAEAYSCHMEELEKIQQCKTIDDFYGFVEPQNLDLALAKQQLNRHQYSMLLEYILRGDFYTQVYSDMDRSDVLKDAHEGGMFFSYGGKRSKTNYVKFYCIREYPDEPEKESVSTEYKLSIKELEDILSLRREEA